MANIAIFNPTNGRILEYKESVNTPEYAGRPDVLINPVMPAGVPIRFLKVVSGVPTEMTQGEKDTIMSNEAAAAAQAIKDAAKAQIDTNTYIKAAALYSIQQIKAAVPGYTQPNKQAVMNGIKAIIDSGAAD